jgi:hypothetical protein
VRLGARGTQRLTNRLRLALEPECLENPTATAREIPRDGADSVRDTQAVCGFRCWASNHAPLFHAINTMVAIFLAKESRRPDQNISRVFFGLLKALFTRNLTVEIPQAGGLDSQVV